MAYQEVIAQGLAQFTEFQTSPIVKLLLLAGLILLPVGRVILLILRTKKMLLLEE